MQHLYRIIFLLSLVWVFTFQAPDGVRLQIWNETLEECKAARELVIKAIGPTRQGWLITGCGMTREGGI